MIRHYGSESGKKFAAQLRELSATNDRSEGLSAGPTGHLSLRTCALPGSKSRQNIVFLDEYPDLVVNDFIRSILTAREIDVLTLVASGMQNKEIAEKLFVSVNTIKRHLDNLFGKFNVSSRTRLIAKFYYLSNCD